MNSKKIVVFWDDKGFDAVLRNNVSFAVCNSQSEFKALDEIIINDAIGFLVLCELPWDDRSPEIPRTEFGGIRLVQRYIRKEKNLKAPVVFASFSDMLSICEKHRDYRIIKTPVLKHQFIRLPALRKELLHAVQNMENQTDVELAYTKLIYCDIRGLIVQINHILDGRGITEQDKYRKDIEFVLREQFPNDKELLNEYNNAQDLSDFCKIILKRMDFSSNSKDTNDFLFDHNHKTIRILLLDDEPEKDHNVGNFIKYIQELENKANKEGTNPLFEITVEKDAENISYGSAHDLHDSKRQHSLSEYDVFISDIEIWNDNDELVSLGFEVIEQLAKKYKKPLYYIVTNVSRSFYDQIKIPYVRRIRLKNEVFGSKDKIETFLYGIKEVYDNRLIEEYSNNFYNTGEEAFNIMFDYITKKGAIYPIQIGKPFIKNGSSPIIINSYSDIERKIVRVKTLELMKYFLSLFTNNDLQCNPNDDGDNFIVFHKNCEQMRRHIKNAKDLHCGNDNFAKNILKQEAKCQIPSNRDIVNFILKMIMRRFFLYIKAFMDHYRLMDSFEKYKDNSRFFDEKTIEENKGIKGITIMDIACRAINDQFMRLNGEYVEGKGKDKQNISHCIEKTLLMSKQREPLRLTNEEQNFVHAIGNDESVFSTDESLISQLIIDY